MTVLTSIWGAASRAHHPVRMRKILCKCRISQLLCFLGQRPAGCARNMRLCAGIYDYRTVQARGARQSETVRFCIPPMQPGTTVAVFEAAIDAMAEMTLCGMRTSTVCRWAGFHPRQRSLWRYRNPARHGNHHDRTAAGQRAKGAWQCRHSRTFTEKSIKFATCRHRHREEWDTLIWRNNLMAELPPTARRLARK